MLPEGVMNMDEDPWKRESGDEPPSLDEIFNDVFGQKKKGGGSSGSLLFPFVLIGSIVLLASGFFIVSPSEQGVVLRFGKVVRVVGPGPNWAIPIIESRQVVNTQKISSYNYSAEMLTRDESYADVDVTVFYRVKEPVKYLFNDVNAIESLAQSTASALRQVVGNTELEAILTDGRVAARDQIQVQVEKIMSTYDNGIEVTDTKLQDAKPPQPVKEAFDDVIQAREDYDRYIMNAEAYRNELIPEAEGKAMRIANQANAEAAKVVNEAHAKVAGFNALVTEYGKHPEIVRNQLFISTMQSVYERTRKIFVNSEGNLNVLPFDKLVNKESGNE